VLQVAEYGFDAEVAAHVFKDNSQHFFINRSHISKQGCTPQKGAGWQSEFFNVHSARTGIPFSMELAGSGGRIFKVPPPIHAAFS
jgi:hypothetical protein